MALNPPTYTKQPWEEETISIDFTNRITGDSVLSATVKIYDSDEKDVTATMLDSSSVASPYVYAKIKAGTPGGRWNIQIRVTTTNGDLKEEDLPLYVTEED